MSRALDARLRKLERASKPPASRVVVIPWRDWPHTEDGMEALWATHPHAQIIMPSQAASVAEWEDCA